MTFFLCVYTCSLSLASGVVQGLFNRANQARWVVCWGGVTFRGLLRCCCVEVKNRRTFLHKRHGSDACGPIGLEVAQRFLPAFVGVKQRQQQQQQQRKN